MRSNHMRRQEKKQNAKLKNGAAYNDLRDEDAREEDGDIELVIPGTKVSDQTNNSKEEDEFVLKWDFALPQNVYTLAMVAPLLVEPESKHDNWCNFLLRSKIFSYNLVLLISHVYQAVLVYFIYQIQDSRGNECFVEDEHSVLSYICVTIFVFNMSNDLEETVHMRNYLSELYDFSEKSREEKEKEKEKEKRSNDEEEKGEDALFNLPTAVTTPQGQKLFDEEINKIMETFDKNDCDRRGTKFYSNSYYYWVCFYVLSTKLVIGALLLWYGSLYIARSENDVSTILDAVALEYIFQIDEYVYNFYISDTTKALVENLPKHTKGIKKGSVGVDALGEGFPLIFMRFTYACGALYLMVEHYACYPNEEFTDALTNEDGSLTFKVMGWMLFGIYFVLLCVCGPLIVLFSVMAGVCGEASRTFKVCQVLCVCACWIPGFYFVLHWLLSGIDNSVIPVDITKNETVGANTTFKI